jgi:hypothetical protein
LGEVVLAEGDVFAVVEIDRGLVGHEVAHQREAMQQLVHLAQAVGGEESRARSSWQNMCEQLDVVAMLEFVAVRVGGAQDERAGVRPPSWARACSNACPNAPLARSSMTGARPPRSFAPHARRPAERSKRGDLEQSILGFDGSAA